jgi:hypothetical protein
VEDSPGKLCPNPRVILPRRMLEDILDGPQRVDVRSFGVRCPATHRDSQLYGILAMIQVLSPALAWLWRLVAPRGHANPSIQDSKSLEMQSEGVGSYWAFATGRRVDQANLLLRQIENTPETRYVLLPNQHIGAWKVGFMAEWIAREYLARRGSAKFGREQVGEAICWSHSFPNQPKTKSQWDFNPNALTLPYVLIIVGAAVSLFVFRFFVSHEAFIR